MGYRLKIFFEKWPEVQATLNVDLLNAYLL